MPTRDDKLTGQRPKPSRRSLIIATIVVSIILVVVPLVTAEGVMRLVRPAPPRGSLVLDDELGWDRTPSVDNPIPATAPTAPGAQPLRILFMGDSFTHNTAWSRLTIEELNRRGIAAMGWEAGVEGYGQVQEWMKLAREVADAIERWRTNPPPSSAPPSAPSSSPTSSPIAPPVR